MIAMIPMRQERRDAMARLFSQQPKRRRLAQKSTADSMGLPFHEVQAQEDQDVFKTIARERGMTPMDLEMRLLASNEAELKQMQRSRIEGHAKAIPVDPGHYFAAYQINPNRDFGESFVGMI
jgi:hypothetical protein